MLELLNDPAILNGNEQYRKTHAGGTQTMCASAANMSDRVCGDLCDVDRVNGLDGVHSAQHATTTVLELTSSTAVGRTHGF